MLATIIKYNEGYGTVEARTDNDLMLVFKNPAEPVLHLGDRLDFDLTRLDAVVGVSMADGRAFGVYLAARDVHDLRMPGGHGVSRMPSRDRLAES